MLVQVLRPHLAVVLAIVVVGLSACGQSHGGLVTGVDGSRRMVDLADSDWLAVCRWFGSVRGAEPATYWCMGSHIDTSSQCPAGAGCRLYEWTDEYCLARYQPLWMSAPTTCPATVDEWAACINSQVALGCYMGMPTTASCTAVPTCDAPADGGVPDGG